MLNVIFSFAFLPKRLRLSFSEWFTTFSKLIELKSFPKNQDSILYTPPPTYLSRENSDFRKKKKVLEKRKLDKIWIKIKQQMHFFFSQCLKKLIAFILPLRWSLQMDWFRWTTLTMRIQYRLDTWVVQVCCSSWEQTRARLVINSTTSNRCRFSKLRAKWLNGAREPWRSYDGNAHQIWMILI